MKQGKSAGGRRRTRDGRGASGRRSEDRSRRSHDGVDSAGSGCIRGKESVPRPWGPQSLMMQSGEAPPSFVSSSTYANYDPGATTSGAACVGGSHRETADRRTGTDWGTLLERREAPGGRREAARRVAVEREIVEAHGLSLGDRVARDLVARWHAAASELRTYVAARGDAPIDLEDVSTLAAMYVNVCQVA
jgi:hypothetical protein